MSFIGGPSSPSNPLTLRFRIDGLTQTVSNLNNMVNSELPMMKQRVLQRAAKVLEYQAQQKVHVITGKTKRSIKSSPAASGGDSVGITAGYGAKFEEKKGSPHDFMTQAKNELAKIVVQDIILPELNNMLQRSQTRVF